MFMYSLKYASLSSCDSGLLWLILFTISSTRSDGNVLTTLDLKIPFDRTTTETGASILFFLGGGSFSSICATVFVTEA